MYFKPSLARCVNLVVLSMLANEGSFLSSQTTSSPTMIPTLGLLSPLDCTTTAQFKLSELATPFGYLICECEISVGSTAFAA